jgi:DNA polymerase III delta subunit
MPVIVLAGDEEFEISRRVAELKTSLLDQDWASMNFVRLDNPSLPAIIEAAASLPFGQGNRFVLVDRCEMFTKRRGKAGTADSAKPADRKKASGQQSKDSDAIAPEVFAAALASVYERTYVVFACPHNFDSTLKISKAVAQITEPETFSKEKYFPGSKNVKLETWCRKEAKRFGATIEDGAIWYLLEGTEADLRQISAEIEKAAIAALPNTHITLDLVARLSPHHSNVFAFADQWLNGRLPEAMAALEELGAQQSVMPVLAAVQTMLSKWIKMKLLSDDFNESLSTAPTGRKELPMPELAKLVAQELKLMAFSVERDLKRLSKHTSEELIAKRIELARLEFLIKSGQIPDKHALEFLVLGS